MKIYFGAAGAGRAYTNHSNIEPDFFMDNDKSKWGKFYLGKEILPPSFFNHSHNIQRLTHVVITSGYLKSILPQLLALGVPREKIIIPPKSWLGDHPFEIEENRVESARFLASLMGRQTDFGVVAAGGTALGFARERDFTLWDFDFDLFAPLKSKDPIFRFLLKVGCTPYLEAASIKATLNLKNGDRVPFSVDFFDTTNSVFVDVYEDHVWEWPTTMFDNPQVLRVHGYEVSVPDPIEVYLSGVYGDDWSTPRPEFNYFDYGK